MYVVVKMTLAVDKHERRRCGFPRRFAALLVVSSKLDPWACGFAVFEVGLQGMGCHAEHYYPQLGCEGLEGYLEGCVGLLKV